MSFNNLSPIFEFRSASVDSSGTVDDGDVCNGIIQSHYNKKIMQIIIQHYIVLICTKLHEKSNNCNIEINNNI